jgi:hypothetical protein
MSRALAIRCLVATVLVAGTIAAAAEPDAPEVESLRLCRAADVAHGEAREAMLERALELATYATERTPDRADAHFAVFCALGKQLDDQGVGWGSLGAIRRVRRAVDRTLELNPDHVGALVGKARMLMRLPRILGGDPAEARRCLERAHRVRPDDPAGAALWRHVAGPATTRPAD